MKETSEANGSKLPEVTESEMHVLYLVEKFTNKERIPNFNDLSTCIRMAKAQLEFTISELLQKQFLNQLSLPEPSGYVRQGYAVTKKGKETLVAYVKNAQKFVNMIIGLEVAKDERYQIIELIDKNRDLLWFAYYRGLITKRQIENIAKKLHTSVSQIWWPIDYTDGPRLM